ncbi:MFS transporter [Streptomyces sp. NPDC001380]|uniref:MFS transporter n=1 Tax=Streptomyces sp. NPDC001380 TaxID=3364566 RepID=UPI0036B930AB
MGAADAAAGGGLPGPRPQLTAKVVLAVLGPATAFAVTAVDPLMLGLNLSRVSGALDVPPQALGFLAGAATLVVAAAVLAVGNLGDAHGLKRTLMLGLAGTVVANLLSALATGYPFLLVARLLDGLALAALLGLSLALLNVSVPPETRPAAIGILMAVDMLLYGVTPAVGGWVVERLGWRWLFLPAPLLALCALALTARYTSEPGGRRARRVDTVGVVLFGAALLALVHGVGAAQNGLSDPRAWVPLAAGAAAAAAFVRHERRVAEPALDLALFRRPAFAVAVLATVTLNFISAGFSVVLAQFGGAVLALPAQTIGLLYLPGTLLATAAALLAGRMVARYTPRPVMVTGLLLLTGSGLVTAGTAAPSMAPWLLVPAVWLCNVGCLVTSTPVSETVLSHAPPGRSGAVASVQPAFGMTGYALGPTVCLLLLDLFFHRRWLADAEARGLSAGQAGHAVDAARSALAKSPGTAGYDPNLVAHTSGLDLGVDYADALRLTVLAVSLAPLVLAVAAHLVMPRPPRTGPERPAPAPRPPAGP